MLKNRVGLLEGLNPLSMEEFLIRNPLFSSCRSIGFFSSKLDLCEGGSVSPTIFKSDIELSVYHISCFIFVCRFGALLKAKRD